MSKLTKAQQEELDTLRRECEMAKALSWPNFPKPTPIPFPPYGDSLEKYSHGWACNRHSGRVYEAWNSYCYGYTRNPSKPDPCGSQTKETIYATESYAYLAMYHEMARDFAGKLADVLERAGKARKD